MWLMNAMVLFVPIIDTVELVEERIICELTSNG